MGAVDPSIEMPFEIIEDVGEELEDFVYLARLGCVEDARRQYDEILVKHQRHCFPIVAEFADLLISTMQDEEAYEFLGRFLWHDFGDEDGKQNYNLMKGMLDLVETRIAAKKPLSDPPSVLTQTPVPRMKQIILEGTSGEFASVEYHRLELLLTQGVFLAPNRVRIRYSELCKPLISSQRYWEAQVLLSLSISGTDDLEEARKHFVCFFECIAPFLSDQSAKLAQLSALIQYLTFIRAVQVYDRNTVMKRLGNKHGAEMLEMPQKAIDDAESLLVYFFEDLRIARGLLFEKWHALALHFVDQERDKLIAETLQEDEGSLQGSRPTYDRPGKGRPIPTFPTLTQEDDEEEWNEALDVVHVQAAPPQAAPPQAAPPQAAPPHEPAHKPVAGSSNTKDTDLEKPSEVSGVGLMTPPTSLKRPEQEDVTAEKHAARKAFVRPGTFDMT